MKLLSLYLRRERSASNPGKFDVVAYADANATISKASWEWWHSNKPTKRNRRVMLNCFYWEPVWLPSI